MTYGVPNVKKLLVGQIKQLNIWILEKSQILSVFFGISVLWQPKIRLKGCIVVV